MDADITPYDGGSSLAGALPRTVSDQRWAVWEQEGDARPFPLADGEQISRLHQGLRTDVVSLRAGAAEPAPRRIVTAWGLLEATLDMVAPGSIHWRILLPAPGHNPEELAALHNHRDRPTGATWIAMLALAAYFVAAYFIDITTYSLIAGAIVTGQIAGVSRREDRRRRRARLDAATTAVDPARAAGRAGDALASLLRLTDDQQVRAAALRALSGLAARSSEEWADAGRLAAAVEEVTAAARGTGLEIDVASACNGVLDLVPASPEVTDEAVDQLNGLLPGLERRRAEIERTRKLVEDITGAGLEEPDMTEARSSSQLEHVVTPAIDDIKRRLEDS